MDECGLLDSARDKLVNVLSLRRLRSGNAYLLTSTNKRHYPKKSPSPLYHIRTRCNPETRTGPSFIRVFILQIIYFHISLSNVTVWLLASLPWLSYAGRQPARLGVTVA